MMWNHCKYKSVKVIGMALVFAIMSIFSANLNISKKVSYTQVSGKIDSMSSSEDTYTDAQWYIYNPGYYINYSGYGNHKIGSGIGIDMDVSKAWDSMVKTGAAKREVVVAVIDTGVDYTHPDLSENIWSNKGEIAGDGIDNDDNGYVDDVYGWDFYNNDASICHYDNSKTKRASLTDNDNHGTHIAGIIAAVADNNTGIAGIASNINIKIMVLKINGGSDRSGKMSDAIEAIKYATMMGADICNLSWGTNTYSKGLYKAIKESDMLFVAAAGNSGEDNDEEAIYPANFKLNNVISVTSIDSKGKLNSYSNYGSKTVDIAAPGNDIYSTIVGDYGTMSGSSMAVPQVTGVAALLYSYANHIYASNVKNIIIDNLKPLPELEGKMIHPGIPDAYKVIESAKELIKDTVSPEMTFKTIYDKIEMTIPVTIKDSGDSQIRVIKWIYGDKKAEDFKRGVNGTSVKDNKINIADAGVYTFYASDYAGNETVSTYKVIADTKVPDLYASYMIMGGNKIRTVTVKASDLQSGLNRIKYMPGFKRAEDFLPARAGTPIRLKDGIGTFSVKKDGIYTIFASDNRGNMVIKTIIIRTLKITEYQFPYNIKT